jgi:hypothetical protein
MALIMAGHYAVGLLRSASTRQIPASRCLGRAQAAVRANLREHSLRWCGRIAGGFLRSLLHEVRHAAAIGNHRFHVATEIGRPVSVYPINLTLASALASTLLTLAARFISELLLCRRQRVVRAAARDCPIC